MALQFDGARAETDGIHAWGKVDLRLFSCAKVDLEVAQHGQQRLHQILDETALIQPGRNGNCGVLHLGELDLRAAAGPLGIVTQDLGVFRRARAALTLFWSGTTGS